MSASPEPSDAQIDARIVEITELGPAGADHARAELARWHAQQDLVPRLMERVAQPGLGLWQRVAVAELLAQWRDPRVIKALSALSLSGDPTLVAAAVEISARAPWAHDAG